MAEAEVSQDAIPAPEEDPASEEEPYRPESAGHGTDDSDEETSEASSEHTGITVCQDTSI